MAARLKEGRGLSRALSTDTKINVEDQHEMTPGKIMPRRNDIAKILVIGSGPIVIGQSAEFDYSGTQACKALKAEGYEVVLINSNPASIMTDPEIADRTYIEPLTTAYVEESACAWRCAMIKASGASGSRSRCCRRSVDRQR